jgi:hydrogenase small subunit
LYPGISEPIGSGATIASAALAAGLGGIALGAGAVIASRLGKEDEKNATEQRKE